MPRIPDRSKYLIIRLALYGCTNRPFYNIVVCKNRQPRNGHPIEILGSYDPMPNKYGEKLVALNMERFKYNLAKGTQLTKPVEQLLGLSGLIPIHPMTYIRAERLKQGKELEHDTSLRHWRWNVYELLEKRKIESENAQENTESTIE